VGSRLRRKWLRLRELRMRGLVQLLMKKLIRWKQGLPAIGRPREELLFQEDIHSKNEKRHMMLMNQRILELTNKAPMRMKKIKDGIERNDLYSQTRRLPP